MLRHVKNSIVPHQGNQYRPHLIRHYGLTAVLLVLLALTGLHNLRLTGRFDVLSVATDISIIDLLSDTNSQREQNKAKALKLDEQLTRAAQKKAEHMLANNYWSHVAPDGTEPWDFFEDQKYEYDRAGENLAYGFSNSEETVVAWMNSPGHRANLLDKRFTEVGFGYATGDFQGSDNTVVVALYGRPDGSAPLSDNSTPNQLTVAGTTQVPAEASSQSNFAAALKGRTPLVFALTMWVSLLIGLVFAWRHAIAVRQLVTVGHHHLQGHPMLEASLVYLLIWMLLFSSYGALT